MRFWLSIILGLLCNSDVIAMRTPQILEASIPNFSAEQKAFFEENGYLGPLPLFSREEAEAFGLELDHQIQKNPLLNHSKSISPDILQSYQEEGQPPYGEPCYWRKSLHILMPEVAAIGQCKPFFSLLHDLLGPDILLWGAQLVKKNSKKGHRWHVDIEHMAWEGLTFWLPLNNVSAQSTIKFIPGSHHYNFIPQSLGSKVDLKDDKALLEAVHAEHPDAKIVSINIKPGQFVLFSGKTWHSTINHTDRPRQALIFQYCRPDARVRIPLNFEIPTIWAYDQPWVLKVSGEDRFGINHLYP